MASSARVEFNCNLWKLLALTVDKVSEPDLQQAISTYKQRANESAKWSQEIEGISRSLHCLFDDKSKWQKLCNACPFTTVIARIVNHGCEDEIVEFLGSMPNGLLCS